MSKLWSWVVIVSVALAPIGCDDDDEDGDETGHELGVGNKCEGDDDSETGTCYLGPGGGYCTSLCTDEGDTS